MPVPLFDTKTPLAPLREQIDAAIAGVLDAGSFILGPDVKAFEEEFAAYCGARHAVGVGNGTDALTIALRAMGVGPGDDVVVPSFTFYASAEAIPPTGARPVFCDVDPETFCVTPETVKAALTPEHEGRHRGPPVRQRRAGRRDRGARRPGPRGRGAGRRHDDRGRPPRRARHRRHVQLLPVQEPRLLRRRRRDHDERRRGRRPRAHAALPRLVRTRSPTSTSVTTRGSTRSRPRSCASCCRISTTGPTAAAAPARTTRRPASASSSTCRCRRTARAPRGTSTW